MFKNTFSTAHFQFPINAFKKKSEKKFLYVFKKKCILEMPDNF